MRIAAALLTVIALSACTSGKRASAENDRLRTRVVELEQEVQRLADQNAELKVQLRQSAAEKSVSEEIRASTPQVVRIAIDPLSHARDEDGDDRPDLLTLYLEPADGRGRFVQLVGHLSAHAAVLPDDADAVTIGRVSLGPAEVREAYRSTIVGTHYTVTVPLTLTGSIEADECMAKVVYTDGRTGLRRVAERGIKLTP